MRDLTTSRYITDSQDITPATTTELNFNLQSRGLKCAKGLSICPEVVQVGSKQDGGERMKMKCVDRCVQGDHSTCSKPPVDFKTEVPFWPGQARTGQAKAELLF